MENLFLKYGNKKECNGCGACKYICPVNAIEMVTDEEGFEYPCIDEKKCIHCNKCKRYCSNFNENSCQSVTYRGINKNLEDLKISSSGGIFLALARKVIEEKGVVFGVKYEDNLNVVHDFAESMEDVKKFCGSKYVRSDLKNTYQLAKKFLDSGRKVLFTGTSCQIQGLNIYLEHEYDNLLTMDIICHANPSPKVFQLYIKEIEKSRNKRIKNISFRTKENGWRNQTPVIEYVDGTKEEEKTFLTSFLKEMINRPVCYQCKFATENRISDITIGDFWGVEEIEPELEEKLGVSVLLVNTDKGKNTIKKLENYIDLKEINFNRMKDFNHFHNVDVNLKRKRFFRDIENGKNVLEIMKKYNHDNIIYKVVNKVRKIVRRKNGGK